MHGAAVHLALLLVAAWPLPGQGSAQQASRERAPGRLARRWSEAAAGSEAERYLRLAESAGALPGSPWSVRAFGPGDAAWRGPTGRHPWAGAFHAPLRRGWWLVRPNAEGVYNSGFALSQHDGPMWAGRGGTAAASLGIAGRVGPLTFQVAPQLWWTQNRDYALLPIAGGRFGDFASGGIDLPQRLATGALGRVDPGESFVRMDLLGLTAGVSSAAEWWGPGVASGVMFSNNAGGMPRVFAGTSRPLNVGIGTVHGRVVAGRLARSGVFDNGSSEISAQLLTGMIGVFRPRPLPGLELGATRLFHADWPTAGPGWRDLRILWSPLAPNVITSGFTPGNQLASVFARLAVPGRGVELYLEFARDDHNSFNNLDLITEPEHDAALVMGFQRRLGAREAPVWWAVRGETTNGRMTHLDRVRAQVLLYSHGAQIAGHTLRGQLLGSPAVRGGSGAELGVDRYSPKGRLGVRWWRQGLAVSREGGLGYGALQALEGSMLRFTAAGDLSLRVGVVARVGVSRAYDATNVQIAAGWRPTH
jgi:hypothetical protein